MLRYAIVELCINIHQSSIDDLHQDLSQIIEKYAKNNDTRAIIFTLKSFNDYFSKTTVYNVQNAQSLIVETLSLISNDSSEKDEIYQLLGKFLTVS